MNLLSLNKITYDYDAGTSLSHNVLKDISLDINEGEFIGLIGHTGSGKSTLIQHLNGLLKPTSGEVCFHGHNVWEDDYDRKDLRKKVSLVFQYPDHQLFEETILKDVMFGPKNKGFSEEEQMEKAIYALKLVGVEEDQYRHSPFELSGGQKRRVAIAGALAMEPEILVLDEPTAGLDPKGRRDILDQIKKLQQELNLTVVLVSHSMEDVAKYVDRLLVVDNGQLLYDGSPDVVFTHTKELEAVGLKAPETTYILKLLKEKGFDVNPEKIKISDTVDEIINALK